MQPGGIEPTWISEAAVACALAFAGVLWLHLKSARMALARLKREHIVLDTQLSLAADIQRGLLRSATPADDVRWAARSAPAGPIGGDLYDLVRSSSDSWLTLIGDVSGKGIPAALVLASIRTMFEMMIGETDDPAELVERMSQKLYEDYGGMPYLTCVVARIDVTAHRIAYVNAGHPSGLVIAPADRQGDRWVLQSCGPPAGLFPGQKYETTSILVPGGAVAILLTDGITEAFDLLGLSRIDAIPSPVGRLPDLKDPGRICDALIESTASALGRGGWQDDRTVVAFVIDA